MTGATPIAAISRSLHPKDSKPSAAVSNPAARDDREDGAAFDSDVRSNAAKTFGVGAGTRGLTRTAKISGNRIAGPSSSPIPLMVRACRERQARTSAPVARAEAHTRGSSMGNPASFARSRKAAAASAEPPPSPAAAGNRLMSSKTTKFQLGYLARQRPRGAQDEILVNRARFVCPGTNDIETQVVAVLKRKPVA